MKKNNQSGFSIVEVLMAFGLTGFLVLAILRLSDNVSSLEARSSADMDAKELISGVRLTLEEEKNCRASFEGLKFKKADIENIDSGTGLNSEVWTGDGITKARIAKLFTKEMRFGKLTVESLQLFMNNSTGTYPDGEHSDLATLRVKYSFNINKVIQRHSRDLLVKMLLKTSGGETTILSCTRSTGGVAASGVKNYKTFKHGKCVVLNQHGKTFPTLDSYDELATWGKFYCPNHTALTGIAILPRLSSDGVIGHHTYQCCDVAREDNSVAERGVCLRMGRQSPVGTGAEENNPESKTHSILTCPEGWVAAAEWTEYSSPAKDHEYARYCCDYGITNKGLNRWVETKLTYPINQPMKAFKFSCPADQFICGFQSDYKSKDEGRIYGYRCCKFQYEE